VGFFDFAERAVSKVTGAIGGIAGGIFDIGQQIGGQVVEQLPGAILGGLLGPGGGGGGGGPVFTPTSAPTTRLPEPFAVPRVPRSAFDPSTLVQGGTLPSREETMALNLALPGGALLPAAAGVAGRVIPRIITGLGTLGGISELGEFFGGGEEQQMAGTMMFPPSRTSVRAARVFVVPHPQTGAPTFFGHLGRPLLFSRDLSAARRVDRLARRARRVKRGR
jgi:hypothetical protein